MGEERVLLWEPSDYVAMFPGEGREEGRKGRIDAS